MSEPATKLDTPEMPRRDTVRFTDVTVFAAVSNRETQFALSSAFAEIEGIDTDFAPIGANPVSALQGKVNTPDVYFFEARDAQQAEQWVGAMRAPATSFRRHLVVLMPEPSKSATIHLLQSGADDVLSTRPNGIEVTRSLARARAGVRDASATPANDSSESHGARLIVVIHASGGQGATTFAVNAAVQLQSRLGDGDKACLFDFDLQFGDAHLQLDLTDHSRMLDLLKSPERLDGRMLDELTVAGPGGLRVFTTPETPMPLDALSSDTVDRILSLARRRYRYVVVDLPVALARWTETALQKADQIFLVTQVNVPALRATRRLLDLLANERVTNAPITIVANRFGSKGLNPITQGQAEKALDRPIGVSLPNDYVAVTESLDQGVPISTLRPTSRLSQTIGAAMDSVAGPREPKAPGKLAATLARFGRK